MHPERTADPAVLRWVVHHPALVDSPAGRRTVAGTSPFASLVEAGLVDDIVVAGGDVLVRAGDADRWASIAGDVRAALRAELVALDSDASHWLRVAVGPGPSPSIAEVQAVVDRAAGEVMALHGGHLEVIEATGGRAVLRATGACHGCSASASTVLGSIRPALRRAFPQLVEVTIADSTESDGACLLPPTVALERPARRFRRSNRSCH